VGVAKKGDTKEKRGEKAGEGREKRSKTTKKKTKERRKEEDAPIKRRACGGGRGTKKVCAKHPLIAGKQIL